MEKQVLQVGISKTKQLMKQLTLWLLHLSIFISNSGDADHPQMGTIKSKAMASVPCRYGRVVKAAKHQAPDEAYHKVNAIERCKMDSMADTYGAVKNWRLLSTTGQRCDVKVFHNSYEAITNVPVGRSATELVHDGGTVYILIFNEALFFGESMEYSLINPNQIR